jgi:AbrB family looped-hinge helix DNA binding protein
MEAAMGRHEKLTTTVSTKGQVILPKELRDLLNWKPGTRLVVERSKNGVYLSTQPIFPPTRLEDVIGCANYTGPTISIEEMDAAVAREAKRRARY